MRTTNQEKVFVTPSAIKQKFYRLLDVMQKKPKEAAEALKKVFPEGLKMKWGGEKWEIGGVMAVGKGMREEIMLTVE